MKVISNLQTIDEQHKTVLTLGMYDGVHRGHQKIIQFLNDVAKKKGHNSCLLTFWPHPRTILNQDHGLKLLTTQEEKIQLLSSFGLDMVYVQPFDKNFSRKKPIEFVRDFLVNQLHIKTLIIGHDHRFGRNREGNYDLLEELASLYEYEVHQLEAILEKDITISSTKIRNALEEGDLSFANEALGYDYLITGKVIKGDGIGKTLGYPTINLEVPPYKLIPKDGVYGVTVKIDDEEYFGLMNIGNRPTVDGREHRIEIFILDYQGNLYDEEVEVRLLTRIRDERKFDSKEDLVEQIKKDENTFRKYIEKR